MPDYVEACLMPGYIEVRNKTWNGAADEIISKLNTAGVRKGQVISIDAHNNDWSGDAIFCAFYDKNRREEGPLELRYDVQNEKYAWNQFYKRAAERSSRIPQSDLVSITGSSDASGSSVLYVFYYAYDTDATGRDIRYVESRRGTWKPTADDIIVQLSKHGAMAGQVISVDAHSNNSTGPAIIGAFWDASMPVQGPLQMDYRIMNSGESWDNQYKFALKEIGSSITPATITSSYNITPRGVTFIFFGAGVHDRIVDVFFDLEYAKVISTTPKFLAKVRVDNCSATKQQISVQFDETIKHKSELKYTEGAEIKPGFNFNCKLPCIVAGEVSRELSGWQSHTWGKSTTISERYKVNIVSAEPHSRVLCCAKANESELEAPFTINWSFGKETKGMWYGRRTWGMQICYQNDDVQDSLEP